MIKNTFLLGLMLCITMPMICQEKMNEFSSKNGYSNIVLALNRLETKKTDRAVNAQEMYEGLGYAKAANMFKSSTDIESADRITWTKLANSARLNANYEEAAYWYSKVTKDGPLPEDLLHYAQSLQATGNCEEAVKWFNMYNNSPTQNKVAFIKNCSEVDMLTNFDEVTLNKLEGLNTEKLDFSARPYKEGIVFTSNRGGNFFSRLVDNWTNNGFTDLYYAKKGDQGFEKPTMFKGAVNGKFHDGVAAFSNDDTVMYFTRSDKTNTGKSKVVNLKIYQVTNSENVNWNSATELPFNSEEFSSCHPTVSKDGTVMYFSSDRPGGFGGMDLYKVTKTNGEWTNPENCGPSINSAGNEVFPFITSEGDLAFSSNGHPGMGGLDIYVARQTVVGSNNWDRIVNAGKPFNTIKDNFGFYMNEDNTSGYISTSKADGENNDDILEWTSNTAVDFFPVLSKEQVFCVVDKKTGTPIKNTVVKVNQRENYESSESTLKSDNNGEFTLTVWPSSIVKVNMSKVGYDTSNRNIDLMNADSPESNCIRLEMKKEDAVNITGTVVNADKKDAKISNAKVTLVNNCNGEETVVNSDRNGAFNFNVPCNCDYRIIGTKKDFSKNTKTIKRKTITCNEKKEVVLSMRKPSAPKPVIKRTPMMGNKELKVGVILPINNINYDYNKSYIRKDAAVELDRVVAVMKQYPNLHVELGSHTDARGSAVYNLTLSSSRAASALQYLVSKGISRDRVSSRGYGETVLLNTCKSVSNCSDEEHEVNRRTEVKIIKF